MGIMKHVAIAGALAFLPAAAAAATLHVTVDGTMYELSTLTTTFDDASSTLQAQPWWGDKSLAETFRDEAFAENTVGNRTIGGESANLYAYGSSAASVDVFFISQAKKGQTAVASSQTYDFVTAVEAVAPVPLPAGAPLLAAGLGGLAWLGRRRRRKAA